MRITHLALPLTVSSFVVAAVVFVACGGSSTNPPINNGDNTPDATAANGDSGGSGDNGGGDNGGGDDAPTSGGGDDGGNPVNDGGVIIAHFDASDVPDGGLPVTPNQIPCGSTPDCNTTSNTCCVSLDGGAQCIVGASATCPAQTAALHCLEAADCTDGKVCCGSYSLAAGTASSACQLGPCGTVQFCRTNGECENHEPCVPQNCDGQNLELCGLFSISGFVQCTAN